MIEVERALRIPVAAEVAWRILGDFSAPRVGEGICRAITVDGEGPGCVRTMFLVDSWGGGRVLERLEEIDERDRYMRYRMIDSGPVPFTNYEGSLRVTPAGPEACVVMFTARFVPVGIEPDAARELSIGNMELALANADAAARALAASSAPSAAS